MPAADAVIAWANIERRALDLHAAGAAGTAGQLQVQATLDFLLGRAAPGQGARSATRDAADESTRQDTHGPQGAWQNAHDSAGGGACQDARAAGRGGGRSGWAVNPVLLVPWDPSLGAPSGPAELPGFGLLGLHDTMELLAAAAENPATRWCLTVGQDGAAAAHGCAAGRRTLDTLTGPARAPPPGWPPASGWRLTRSPRMRASTRTPSPATPPAASSGT